MADNPKLMALDQAVRRFVSPGCQISIGGFTLNRNPMAAVHEIIRQEIRGLHLFAHSNGQGLDELVGTGCVDRIDIAYAGNGRYAPTCICFRRMVQDNAVQVEDYTNFQMALRFMAGAMGIPFMPTCTGLGTDVMEKWGYSPDQREKDDRLPRHKLLTMDNPFSREDRPDKVILVPAIVPDVTIIHAQTADPDGNTRIQGLTFCDIDQAKAARHLIVTCETLAERGELNRSPGDNQIPGFCVDAVVHQPFGAYPTACFGHYDYDPAFLDGYKKTAKDPALFETYVSEKIRATDSHDAYMDLVCPDREALVADPETGYSLKVKR